MYDYTEYREFCNAIQSANDFRSLNSTVRGYLNQAAMQWWHGLRENEQKAIILLDFDPSVVTTMVFFGRDWGFGGSYTDVFHVLLDKADQLVEADTLNGWGYGMSSVVAYAREQANAEKIAREKAAAIAKELNMASGLSELELLLTEHSGMVQHAKKWKEETAREMRKSFLTDALKYLRTNHDKGE